MGLHDAVTKALAEIALTPADKGAAELALTYAEALDGDGDLKALGPLLLTALEALGATPRARAAIAKGVSSETGTRSPLDELRARRKARTHGTSTVDTATS